jgi:glycosyltransferase involved in cell wall biosynthesis
MWRNHHSGGVLTDIAAAFCTKVFCTSKFSYTAKYPKTVLMPVGIDTDLFKRRLDVERKSQSILFLGRIAPVKKPDVLIEALNLLKSKGVIFTASFYGDALPKDVAYAASLKEKTKALGLDTYVSFFAGVPNDQTPAVYSSHEVCVNLSSSGMYDKTIFESMACETLTVASNRNLYDLIEDSYIFEEDDPWMLAERIEDIFAFSAREKEKMGARLRHVVMSHHSLKELGQKIAKELV